MFSGSGNDRHSPEFRGLHSAQCRVHCLQCSLALATPTTCPGRSHEVLPGGRAPSPPPDLRAIVPTTRRGRRGLFADPTGWGGSPWRRAGARATPQANAVWAVQRAAVVAIAPWLPQGRYRLVVRAGATGPDGGPRLTVWVGDAAVQATALASATPPVWRSADYASEVTWSGGRLAVRLELGDISSRDPIRLAYLEHLRLERLAP